MKISSYLSPGIFSTILFFSLLIGLQLTSISHAAGGKKNYVTYSKNCKIKTPFPQWLQQFKHEARQKGVSAKTIQRTLTRITPDKKIIQMDRNQGVFAQDFLTFSNRMVSNYRLRAGKQKIRQLRHTFANIEKRYGVPAPVITAFWGLETDFGANTGNFPTIRSLVTLAWDCRRPGLFRPELIAALKILDRGDLKLSQMKGAWAGELGQTQFIPSKYLKMGVDFDRNGKVDMFRSSKDALASTARLLQSMGWRRGEPWLVEVRIPKNLPWAKTGIDQQYPISYWSKLGIKQRNGRPLSHKHLRASLVLPMGRNGPSFIAYPNFYKVYFNWNSSVVYSSTAAYFATRLSGAPRLKPGKGKVQKLSIQQVKKLQIKLRKLGFDVGEVDGIIGAKTRHAVRTMQTRLRLPADSYPDRTFYFRVMKVAR